jgi:hypothetical protein
LCCVGVLLLPVTPDELQQFDKREVGYQRQLIHIDHVERVPFVWMEEYYSHPHQQIFLSAKKQQQKQQQQPQRIEIETRSYTNYNDLDRMSSVLVSSIQEDTTGTMTSSSSSSSSSLCIWVYVPNEIYPPSREHPIAQSYDDTIV